MIGRKHFTRFWPSSLFKLSAVILISKLIKYFGDFDPINPYSSQYKYTDCEVTYPIRALNQEQVVDSVRLRVCEAAVPTVFKN